MPQVNAAGLALIESFEGCELTAYADDGGVLTIGYGHTGDDVKPGETITKTQAIALLEGDIAQAEHDVASAVEVVLTPNQFAALVSWQFNTGAIANSPGLGCINAQQFQAAWDDHFCLWVHDAAGNKDEGLVRRRAAERALFFKP